MPIMVGDIFCVPTADSRPRLRHGLRCRHATAVQHRSLIQQQDWHSGGMAGRDYICTRLKFGDTSYTKPDFQPLSELRTHTCTHTCGRTYGRTSPSANVSRQKSKATRPPRKKYRPLRKKYRPLVNVSRFATIIRCYHWCHHWCDHWCGHWCDLAKEKCH